ATDPSVVGDPAVGRLGDVEIDADQHLLAGHVDVANRLLGHESSPLVGDARASTSRRRRHGGTPGPAPGDRGHPAALAPDLRRIRAIPAWSAARRSGWNSPTRCRTRR